ncbi:ACP S-malonyltransferase [Waterburya agarophytonicola K14]|uniref:Malonyl CoA-acyl carrier protein transacylase n=1 Tax=Waterburya agarophytonicola KI4 TaxID=2874699 RepID=A0A964FFW1_9CYAN|nr:ACP S-malonyltransferase [Waterburya agarophytonicola]MCC0177492.1 ACP S-malonyltransferase [Waterburya agarophytonicola KI4]
MTKTAWVFPGQGSQTVGMGVDLQDIPTAKTRFETAEKILGWSILNICQGDEKTLARTLYTQPALYVIESILVDLLAERTGLPQLVAGHSLGEYVALYAARVFDFESGLKLVKKRAELMDSAAGGKMAALMKFDRDELTEVLAQTPNVVLANDNSKGQVVISGTPEAVEEVVGKVKAKRVMMLNVSGAFHSPLMQSAAEQFLTVLDRVEFNDAKTPVLSNVEPTPATSQKELKERLARQMTGSVRWREIMLQFSEAEITNIIEVGPGKALCGLLKRTCREIELERIGTLEQLDTKTLVLTP